VILEILPSIPAPQAASSVLRGEWRRLKKGRGGRITTCVLCEGGSLDLNCLRNPKALCPILRKCEYKGKNDGFLRTPEKRKKTV